MGSISTQRVAPLSVLALVACGADTARDDPGQEIRACDVLDLQAATRVLGPGTEHPGGDTEQLTCLYSNAGVGMLILQLGPAELYDQVTVLEPHTQVQIGDRARYNVQKTGVVAVQLLAGDHTATLSVQPIGTSDTDYLERLLSAARDVAGTLP